MAQTFLHCVSSGDLRDVQALMYDRKTAARPFETIHDILRSLSLVQSLPKARNSPNWRQRAPTHSNMSGTEGFKAEKIIFMNTIHLTLKLRLSTHRPMKKQYSHKSASIEPADYPQSSYAARCTLDRLVDT